MRYIRSMATETTKPSMTLGQFDRQFPNEGACKSYLAKVRWPDGKVRCPRCCLTLKVYKTSQPFRWKCKHCAKAGYKFSVLTGTVFENTNAPLRTWFKVAYLMTHAKKGISALQIYRMIDPVRGKKGSYKTAWYMCHRIRAAMKDGGLRKLAGVVEVDETYVGGKAENRHGGTLPGRRMVPGRGAVGKVPVIGAIARKGNVVCQVIEQTDARTLQRFVNEAVSDKVSLVATDDFQGYSGLQQPHESVTHSRGEFVRGNIHTQNLDSFWSLLKRGIVGSFHKVSKSYLPLYLNEFSFRHNHRNDPDIFQAVIAGC